MARPKPSKKETQPKNKIPGFDPVAASDTGSAQGSKPGSSSLTTPHNESTGRAIQPSVPAPNEKSMDIQFSTQTPSHNVGSAGDRGGIENGSIPLRPANDPDPKVPDVENAPEQVSPLSVTRCGPRPGYCTVGRPVEVLANYFKVKLPSNLVLHRYSVTIEPDVKGKKRKQLFKIFLIELDQLARAKTNLVTDFQNLIISRTELPFIQDKSIKYRAEGKIQANDRAQEYTIKIRRVYDQQRLDMNKLLQYTHSQQDDPSFLTKMHVLTETLNILLGHTARSSTSIATVGDKRAFDVSSANPKLDLSGALVALRGYFSSVKIADCNVLSNVSVSYGAFYDPISLDKLMDTYCYAYDLGWAPESLKSLEKFVKGLRVEVAHLSRKENGHTIKKCKTVFGLANQSFDGRFPRDPNEEDSSRQQDHPPHFTRSNLNWKASSGPIGAGPKDVKFFLEKKSENPVPDGPDAGRYISVWDYFREKKIAIREDTCLVNVGNAKFPVYLPPDLCRVNPGQLFRSRLSPKQTDSMIGHAVRDPEYTRKSICEEGLRTMGFLPSSNDPRSQQTHKMPCDISVLPGMITVNGHVLETPNLRYRGDMTTATPSVKSAWHMGPFRQSNGSMIKPKLREAKKLRWWACLVISSKGDVTNVHRERLTSFMQAMNNAGIDTTEPQKRGSIRESNITNGLDSYFNDWSGQGFQLVLIMLPTKSTTLYNQIKQLGDKKYGIQTVCIGGSDKFYNPGMNGRGKPIFDSVSYFANAALKVNLKLMGINHVLDSPNPHKKGSGPPSGSGALGVISEGKTMVLGIDVTHPSPGSAENAPSVAAMVASTDKVLAQWPAALRIQKIDTKKADNQKEKVSTTKATGTKTTMKGARQEMVSDVTSMFLELLQIWKIRNNGLYPENILVYRDGVSESQYAQVLRDELQPLRDACAYHYPSEMKDRHLPRFTLIVVGKRHHTRFFPKPGPNTTKDRNGNPEPGLVVDRTITDSRIFDFFLQSHAAIKGTARPAHYVVLEDEIFTRIYQPKGTRPLPGPCRNVADVIQTLTHDMCYLYGRATRAVSYCPAAFYADRVCERARRYLGNLFDAPDEGLAFGGTMRPNAVDADVAVHERLAGTMFYI